MSFQEKRIGSQAIYVFALAVLMVYLVLAAQYELVASCGGDSRGAARAYLAQ